MDNAVWGLYSVAVITEFRRPLRGPDIFLITEIFTSEAS